MDKNVSIVGGGLAGSEAALQLAEKGWKVKLYEMRPVRTTPAHWTDKCAELVCSNSLKSLRTDTASGLLKEELRLLDCRLLGVAGETSVPAGHALAVDRDAKIVIVIHKTLCTLLQGDGEISTPLFFKTLL